MPQQVPPVVEVDGIALHAVTEAETVEHVMSALDRGEGGLLLTANTDIMRQLRQPQHKHLASAPALTVADGMPLVWASRLQGGAVLPERVTGADLVWRLSEAAARHGRKVFLLGAAPGVAERAADAFRAAYPGLQVCGTHSPPVGFDRDEEQLAATARMVREAGADLVFVALGFPKQEKVALRLAQDMPATWFMGCGGAFDMAAGEVPRANVALQRAGAEWLHRLSQEPRRLAHRYLVLDLPYALGMTVRAVRQRVRNRSSATG